MNPMNEIHAVTLRNLDKQGFDGLDDAAKSQQAWPLRFTPAVSVGLIVIGLALQSPWWLLGMALVALSGALLPGGMLIDTLYNIGVRHLFRAPPLPSTPKPRQFSYLISTAFLTASAVLLYAGWPVLGSVVGGLVAIAGTVLATTHWCLGSFYYRLICSLADARGSAQVKEEPVNTFRYGFETTLSDTNYDDAVERVTAALESEGFGVLTEINVKATLRKKLDVDFRRYVILGACNPSLAHQALAAEPQIGLLLPCNVVVQEAPEGGLVVSIADPRAMFAMVDNPSVAPVAAEAEERLRRVIDAVGGKEAV